MLDLATRLLSLLHACPHQDAFALPFAQDALAGSFLDIDALLTEQAPLAAAEQLPPSAMPHLGLGLQGGHGAAAPVPPPHFPRSLSAASLAPPAAAPAAAMRKLHSCPDLLLPLPHLAAAAARPGTLVGAGPLGSPAGLTPFGLAAGLHAAEEAAAALPMSAADVLAADAAAADLADGVLTAADVAYEAAAGEVGPVAAAAAALEGVTTTSTSAASSHGTLRLPSPMEGLSQPAGAYVPPATLSPRAQGEYSPMFSSSARSPQQHVFASCPPPADAAAGPGASSCQAAARSTVLVLGAGTLPTKDDLLSMLASGAHGEQVGALAEVMPWSRWCLGEVVPLLSCMPEPAVYAGPATGGCVRATHACCTGSRLHVLGRLGADV